MACQTLLCLYHHSQGKSIPHHGIYERSQRCYQLADHTKTYCTQYLGRVMVLHPISLYITYSLRRTGFILYKIIVMTWIAPVYLSPMRTMPGPPVSTRLLGILPEILRSKPGELHKKWIKNHGPTIRLLGPFGNERFMTVKPEALHQILVGDWLINPRVSWNCITTDYESLLIYF